MKCPRIVKEAITLMRVSNKGEYRGYTPTKAKEITSDKYLELSDELRNKRINRYRNLPKVYKKNRQVAGGILGGGLGGTISSSLMSGSKIKGKYKLPIILGSSLLSGIGLGAAFTPNKRRMERMRAYADKKTDIENFRRHYQRPGIKKNPKNYKYYMRDT